MVRECGKVGQRKDTKYIESDSRKGTWAGI